MTEHRKTIRHFDEPGHVHELTFSCYHRQPLLLCDIRRRMFCNSLSTAVSRYSYDLLAYVIMPEHVHLLVQPSRTAGTISEFLKAIKRPFSYRVKKLMEQEDDPWLQKLTIRQRPGVMTFRFWQEGPGYDRNLTSPTAIQNAIDYSHANPVRRRLCERAVEWTWSSARSIVLGPDAPGIVLPVSALSREMLE